MFYRHLSDTAFYNNLDINNPFTITQTVNYFPEKYKSISTNNEHDFLNKLCHKISNMLPKLHKSKEINKIIEIKRTENIQTDKNILIDSWSIVAGPAFDTNETSKVLYYIMKPSLYLIPQIVKDSFDFTQKLER